jgi:acetylglutamate kinase
MIHADYLFLLTDVDGLYTTNPQKDPNAKQIEVVDSISKIRGEGKDGKFILSVNYSFSHDSEHDDTGFKSRHRRDGD